MCFILNLWVCFLLKNYSVIKSQHYNCEYLSAYRGYFRSGIPIFFDVSRVFLSWMCCCYDTIRAAVYKYELHINYRSKVRLNKVGLKSGGFRYLQWCIVRIKRLRQKVVNPLVHSYMVSKAFITTLRRKSATPVLFCSFGNFTRLMVFWFSMWNQWTSVVNA